MAVSVLVGLAAVYLASRWVLQHNTADASYKVVGAAQDISQGTLLAPHMLKLLDRPRGGVAKGASSDLKKLEGRVLVVSLLQNQLILESQLAPLGSVGGLSAVIAQGNRAMTVRVNDVVGVAGFALPGNYVDIVVNTEDERIKADGVNKSISKIVLERILVLAVAQEQTRDDTKPKVVNAVTLEVTPEQAEKLDLARSVGQLSLVLRNQIDAAKVTTSGSTKLHLFGPAEPVAAAPLAAAPAEPGAAKKPSKPAVKKAAAKPSYEQVEVVRGASKTIEEFKR